MDLTEKVARAMCADGGFSPDELMPNDGPRWKYYEHAARAAIAVCAEEMAKVAEQTNRDAWAARNDAIAAAIRSMGEKGE